MNLADKLASQPVFSLIAEAALSLKTDTYLIGGYVRDMLLERPSKDIDIVCVGSGINLANEVARRLGNNVFVTVFQNFGTAQIVIDELALEFVGARKESYRSDSRKPLVENGTLEDDQLRRDFTINALGISLNETNFGELLDPFDGLADLKKKNIRTPLQPATTFSDDPLRMIRAIRFAAQLNFDIEPEAFDAIIQIKERITIVSQERVTAELNKIILSPKPSYGFKLLFESGLLAIIFPEMIALHGVELINDKGHKDNFYHTLKVLDNLATVSNDLWLRWAAILHDIAKPATKRFDKKNGWTFHNHEELGARMVPQIFRRMKLPLNEKMRLVQKLVRLHLRPIALAKEEITDSALRRLLVEAGDDLNALMQLCRADITSKNKEKVGRYLRNFDVVEEKLIELEAKDNLRNFQPVISGELIMQTFDLKPSRAVGLLKAIIREAILEGEVPNEIGPATQFMLLEGAKMGLKPKNKQLSGNNA